MKSKVIVGTLLVAVVLAAGVAQAHPDVFTGRLHKDGVRYYNVTFDETAILWLELYLTEGKTDADIYVFDVTDGDDSRDVTDAISVFLSTVGGYEGAVLSAVAGTKLVVCIVSESGPSTRFSLIAHLKDHTDLDEGNLRTAGPTVAFADGGSFDLEGSVSSEMAGIQASLQRLSAAKRR